VRIQILAPSIIMQAFFKASNLELINRFHKVDGLIDLANLLEVDSSELLLLFYGLRRGGGYYKEFSIPKKTGGERKILAPDSRLKFVQRKLAYVLSLVYFGRPSVHGFRLGRSIITNAECHARKKCLLNIDLKDFFPTIHFGRVRGLLQAKPYGLSKTGATAVAGICCFWGKLPQGAPTSPVISNMVCAKLDYELQALARGEGATYSRYADDITFSTQRRNLSENIVKFENSSFIAGPKLVEIIRKNGFEINKDKIRMRFLTERQEATGLVVNKFPNVKRSFIREIRIMLHMWRKFNLETASLFYGMKFPGREIYFPEIVRGKINFVKLVKTERDPTYLGLAEKFNDLVGKPVFKIVPIKDWPDEEYIPAGHRYRAIETLETIFANADKEILISDNFLRKDIVGLLEKQVGRSPRLKIRLLFSRGRYKSEERKYAECIEAIKKMVSLHKDLSIDCREVLPGGPHGRNIIIDREEVYHSGHSLDQLGSRADSIIRMRIQSAKRDALQDIETWFANSAEIPLI